MDSRYISERVMQGTLHPTAIAIMPRSCVRRLRERLLRLIGLACVLVLLCLDAGDAVFVAKPSWTMDNFTISNTGNVNIKQITWTAGFNCPSHSLSRGNSMKCTKAAATTSVIVKGVPTSGVLPTLVWAGQPSPTTPPPSSSGCPGCLLGNTGAGCLTTNGGDRLTC